MLFFSTFGPAAITAEIDAVSRCHEFRRSVPFYLLQPNNITTLCSTGSHQGVDVVDTVRATDRCRANIEQAVREIDLAALCFMRAAFLTACFPRRFFRANTLRFLVSSRRFLPRF